MEFVRTGYGKNNVKVLFIRRQGSQHYIIELKADVELTLKSRKDYLSGDNGDIIPTDTIKNTVHALAKIKGVRSPESDMSIHCRTRRVTVINPTINSASKENLAHYNQPAAPTEALTNTPVFNTSTYKHNGWILRTTHTTLIKSYFNSRPPFHDTI